MPEQQTSQRWVMNPDGSKTRREILEDEPAAFVEYVLPSPAPVEVEVVEDEAEPAEDEWTIPRTHAEADAQAKERGLVFPEDVTTVKEKQAFLGY